MENSEGHALAKYDIRLQYSGFVIFAAKMLSVLTGLIFQFMVAWYTIGRTGEYDIWFNVSDVLGYFAILVGVAPFWVMRFVARGKEGATKTGFVTNLIISVISTIVYLAFIPFVLSMLGISSNFLPVYLIASLQIVELYALTIFESCLQATIPQTIGYGLLVQQFAKVVLGYVLIVQTGQPLIGALAATIIAIAIQIFYYTRILAAQFKEHIQWRYVKQWLKGSLGNIYNVIGFQIAAYVFIMLYDMGGEGSRGRLGAAATITNVISYSSFLAFALYPKLLAERKKEDVTASLKMVLMFAIPMTVVAIALSNVYITILRRDYPDAGPVLIVLAVDTLITVTYNIFGSVLFGMEKLDQDEEISFKALVKSKLFIVFSLPYLNSAIILPIAYYVLTTPYAFHQPLQAAFSISVINIVGHLITFSILFILARKTIRFDVPWKSISKYIFASAIAGVLLFLLPHPAPIPQEATTIETIYNIAQTVVLTAVGAAVYLGIVMAIDKEARKLPRSILQEIRGRRSSE